MTLHTCVDLDDAVLAECRDVFGAKHIRKDFQGAIEDPEVDVICLATTEKLRLPVIAWRQRPVSLCMSKNRSPLNLEEMREIQQVVHMPATSPSASATTGAPVLQCSTRSAFFAST
jgi:hypothetical protein